MTLDDIPKEIIVLEYLLMNRCGVRYNDIKNDLHQNYIKALTRLYKKFGGEIDVKIDDRGWAHTYFINENGKENLKIWKETNSDIAQELNGIYISKFMDSILNV